MTEIPEIDGPRAEPRSGGPARQLVVLLHGLGADGNDLIALAPYLARVLPEAAFVSPHAHQACDMAPFGRQWFSMQDQSEAAMAAGVRAAAPVVDAFLDAELARLGLGADRLSVLGFSQGGMLALHCGLRRAPPPAAVIGFSTLLLGSDTLQQELAGKPPVLLTHGSADEIIPARAMPMTRQALEAAGVPVESETREGLGHGIDERCLELAMDFLRRHLAAGGPGGPGGEAG